ncbi:MAG: type II toxin-antitoxin system VapC family toxin [Verrucomicrobia bacterium]|nr:type II toxin-antitoxin system VapC family toxin [Verrucomicrobiota bacterium]
MANADDIYVDPIALRRLYVHDDRSRGCCAWRGRTGGCLALTRHGRAELANGICLAIFRGDIDQDAGDAALADVEADLAEGRLAVTDLPWRQALDRARDLSLAHTPTLGNSTLDVLHVASALVLGCRRFVTYDHRQAALAKAVGLRVLSP